MGGVYNRIQRIVSCVILSSCVEINLYDIIFFPVASLIFLQAVAHDAFRALVNLSDSALLTKTLSEPTFLDFVVAYIIVSGSNRLFSLSLFIRLVESPINLCRLGRDVTVKHYSIRSRLLSFVEPQG